MAKLSEAIENYMTACYTLAPRTCFIYREHLERMNEHVGDLLLEEITHWQLIRFMAGLRRLNGKEYSESYQDQIWRTLHTFFEFCVGEKWLSENPMHRVRRPAVETGSKPRLSLSEVEELIRVAAGTNQSYRNVAITLLMVDTGLRVSDVINLRIADIYLEDRSAYIRSPKTKKTRYVPLSEQTVSTLAAYLEKRPPFSSTDEALFLTAKGPRKGMPISKKVIEELMKRLNKKVKFHLHAHLLRHTFANHYIRYGELKKLQKILGHSRVDTTAKFYTDPDFKDIQAEHKFASPTAQIARKSEQNQHSDRTGS